MNLPLFIVRRLSASKEHAFAGMIIRLCIISCALSIAVMIVAIALITGFKKEITGKMFDFWGHVTITDTEIHQSYLPVPVDTAAIQLSKALKITESDLNDFERGNYAQGKFSSQTGGKSIVKHAQIFILFPGILQGEEEFEGIQIKGVGSDFHPEFYDKYLADGVPPRFTDDSISRDIVISRQTADRLQVNAGDGLILHFVVEGDQISRRLNISGIYKTGLEEYDRKVAFADIKLLRQILKWEDHQSAGVEFFMKNIRHQDAFMKLMLEEFIPLDYYAFNLRSRFPAIFEWLELQDYNQYVIIGLMLIVCIFNLITTALILILERTNMIGVLKTLGMAAGNLRMIFVYFSFRILLIALFWGNLLGLTLCFLQKQFKLIRLNEADYYLSEAPVHYAWLAFLAVNVLIMVCIFVFLLIPSTLVQRIDPVKAIRLK